MERVLALVILLFPVFTHAEIYKWTDGAGKVHYSDHRPDNAKPEKLRIHVNSYTSVTYQLPPRTQTTAPISKNVVMYSTSWCTYCKQARAYFASHNIPYTDYDIEASQEAKQNYDAIGGRGVPVILVGNARMNGFSAAGFERLYQQ